MKWIRRGAGSYECLTATIIKCIGGWYVCAKWGFRLKRHSISAGPYPRLKDAKKMARPPTIEDLESELLHPKHIIRDYRWALQTATSFKKMQDGLRPTETAKKGD